MAEVLTEDEQKTLVGNAWDWLNKNAQNPFAGRMQQLESGKAPDAVDIGVNEGARALAAGATNPFDAQMAKLAAAKKADAAPGQNMSVDEPAFTSAPKGMAVAAPAPEATGTGGSGRAGGVGPRVSVGTSAPTPALPAFTSLADSVPTNVGSKEAAGVVAQGKPAQSDEEKEIEAAQNQDKADTWKRMIAGFLAGLSGNQQLLGHVLEGSDANKRAVLEKYQRLQAAQKNKLEMGQLQKQADSGDPNSEVTKQRATMLGAVYGLKVPPGFTADQTADYVAAMKLKGEEKERELNRLREEARDREAGRHNKAEEGLGYAKLETELEKEKLAKTLAAQQGKPIPDMMTPKLSAQVDAPALIGELREKRANVGLSGPLSALPFVPTFGAAKEYENAKKAAAGPLGLAMFPGARSESPELTKMAADTLPKTWSISGSGETQFNNIERNTNRALETELGTLEAGGASPREIQALRQRAAQNAGPAHAQYQTPQAHQAAIQWALQHKDDPDAQQILAMHGG